MQCMWGNGWLHFLWIIRNAQNVQTLSRFLLCFFLYFDCTLWFLSPLFRAFSLRSERFFSARLSDFNDPIPPFRRAFLLWIRPKWARFRRPKIDYESLAVTNCVSHKVRLCVTHCVKCHYMISLLFGNKWRLFVRSSICRIIISRTCFSWMNAAS